MHTGFWWGNLQKIDHMEDPGIDGSINIKMGLEEVGWEGGWIDLAQDRDRWWELVSAVMNLQLP